MTSARVVEAEEMISTFQGLVMLRRTVRTRVAAAVSRGKAVRCPHRKICMALLEARNGKEGMKGEALDHAGVVEAGVEAEVTMVVEAMIVVEVAEGDIDLVRI